MTRDLAVIRFATAMRGLPFQWGVTDCTALAFGVINAQKPGLMRDPWWTDEASARAQLAEQPPSAMFRDAGLVQVDVRDVGVGDLLIGSTDEWAECVHACVGSRCLSCTMDAVTLLPTRMVKAACHSAWRVP